MYGYGYQYGKISGGTASAGAVLAAAYKARVEADGGRAGADTAIFQQPVRNRLAELAVAGGVLDTGWDDG